MDDDRISYEMLQDLVRAERRSNRLSPVQSRFWANLRAFLDDCKAGFREEQQKDPFGRRAMMSRDEVQNALQAAESLWNLRERKMALYALAQPKEGNAERPDGLTAEEIDLYDRFVSTLRQGKAEVFGETAAPVASVPAPAPTPAPMPAPTPMPASTPAPVPGPASASALESEAGEGAVPGSGATPATPPADFVPPDLDEPEPESRESEPESESEPEVEPVAPKPTPAEPPAPTTVPADTPTDEMVTIRALGDIPPFVGPDMQTYLLREGDFAMVPPAIATLLERRGKAELVEAAG